ncbi:hypothetical protein SNEBB_008728 [Seison nebaliae]|nr:hypothetical protein SNEBB_008728 [Seison nebaliae]
MFQQLPISKRLYITIILLLKTTILINCEILTEHRCWSDGNFTVTCPQQHVLQTARVRYGNLASAVKIISRITNEESTLCYYDRQQTHPNSCTIMKHRKDCIGSKSCKINVGYYVMKGCRERIRKAMDKRNIDPLLADDVDYSSGSGGGTMSDIESFTYYAQFDYECVKVHNLCKSVIDNQYSSEASGITLIEDRAALITTSIQLLKTAQIDVDGYSQQLQQYKNHYNSLCFTRILVSTNNDEPSKQSKLKSSIRRRNRRIYSSPDDYYGNYNYEQLDEHELGKNNRKKHSSISHYYPDDQQYFNLQDEDHSSGLVTMKSNSTINFRKKRDQPNSLNTKWIEVRLIHGASSFFQSKSSVYCRQLLVFYVYIYGKNWTRVPFDACQWEKQIKTYSENLLNYKSAPIVYNGSISSIEIQYFVSLIGNESFTLYYEIFADSLAANADMLGNYYRNHSRYDSHQLKNSTGKVIYVDDRSHSYYELLIVTCICSVALLIIIFIIIIVFILKRQGIIGNATNRAAQMQKPTKGIKSGTTSAAAKTLIAKKDGKAQETVKVEPTTDKQVPVKVTESSGKTKIIDIPDTIPTTIQKPEIQSISAKDDHKSMIPDRFIADVSKSRFLRAYRGEDEHNDMQLEKDDDQLHHQQEMKKEQLMKTNMTTKPIIPNYSTKSDGKTKEGKQTIVENSVSRSSSSITLIGSRRSSLAKNSIKNNQNYMKNFKKNSLASQQPRTNGKDPSDRDQKTSSSSRSSSSGSYVIDENPSRCLLENVENVNIINPSSSKRQSLISTSKHRTSDENKSYSFRSIDLEEKTHLLNRSNHINNIINNNLTNNFTELADSNGTLIDDERENLLGKQSLPKFSQKEKPQTAIAATNTSPTMYENEFIFDEMDMYDMVNRDLVHLDYVSSSYPSPLSSSMNEASDEYSSFELTSTDYESDRTGKFNKFAQSGSTNYSMRTRNSQGSGTDKETGTNDTLKNSKEYRRSYVEAIHRSNKNVNKRTPLTSNQYPPTFDSSSCIPEDNEQPISDHTITVRQSEIDNSTLKKITTTNTGTTHTGNITSNNNIGPISIVVFDRSQPTTETLKPSITAVAPSAADTLSNSQSLSQMITRPTFSSNTSAFGQPQLLDEIQSIGQATSEDGNSFNEAEKSHFLAPIQNAEEVLKNLPPSLSSSSIDDEYKCKSLLHQANYLACKQKNKKKIDDNVCSTVASLSQYCDPQFSAGIDIDDVDYKKPPKEYKDDSATLKHLVADYSSSSTFSSANGHHLLRPTNEENLKEEMSEKTKLLKGEEKETSSSNNIPPFNPLHVIMKDTSKYYTTEYI